MFSWALGQVYAMPPSKRPPPGTHPAAPGSAQETVWKAHPCPRPPGRPLYSSGPQSQLLGLCQAVRQVQGYWKVPEP